MVVWNRLVIIVLSLGALLGLVLAAALASAGADSSSSAARRIVPASLDGTLHLADEASDPDSGWAVSAGETAQTSYQDGAYRINLFRPNVPVMPIAPAPACTDYTVAAEMRWGTDATTGVYGVFFGSQEDSAATYLLLLYADAGEFTLLRRTQTSEMVTLIGRTPHAAIQPGQAPNQVRVERDGAAIRATINGQPAVDLVDDTLLGPTVTGLLAASHPAQPVADARFDHFYLNATGCETPQAFDLSASATNTDTTPSPTVAPTATPTGTWTPPPPTATPTATVTPGPTPTLPPLTEKLYLPVVLR